jgi:hypothetical protein
MIAVICDEDVHWLDIFTLIAPYLYSNDGLIWDRCYDFLNIFAEIFIEKIGVFASKQS